MAETESLQAGYNFLLMREDSYGSRKRLEFCARILRERQAFRVLDIGCGTGSNLTAYLAAAFPQAMFKGVDPDVSSVRYGNASTELPNLSFATSMQCEVEPFDVIIASEVIEHVEEPSEFLRSLRSQLTNDGCLLLTLPNGKGPFEMTSLLLNCILWFYPVYFGMVWTRRAWDRILKRKRVPTTLSSSPHINFFSRSELEATLEACGYRIVDFSARTFLCGPFLDQLVRLLSIEEWNAKAANRLPHAANSGWMLVLRKAPRVNQSKSMRRSTYARLKRSLNEKVARNERLVKAALSPSV